MQKTDKGNQKVQRKQTRDYVCATHSATQISFRPQYEMKSLNLLANRELGYLMRADENARADVEDMPATVAPKTSPSHSQGVDLKYRHRNFRAGSHPEDDGIVCRSCREAING